MEKSVLMCDLPTVAVISDHWQTRGSLARLIIGVAENVIRNSKLLNGGPQNHEPTCRYFLSLQLGGLRHAG